MKVAPRSFSLIMARVPALCFQGEKKGRLLLSLVNTNMKVFVIMPKHYRGRYSLVVILALILFFFQFSSLKSYTVHKYEICPESKKIGGVTKAKKTRLFYTPFYKTIVRSYRAAMFVLLVLLLGIFKARALFASRFCAIKNPREPFVLISKLYLLKVRHQLRQIIL